MSLDFGGTLRRAWDITWNHKILWIFGILSAILAGRASFNNGRPQFNPNNFTPNNPDAFPRLQEFFNNNQNLVLAIGLGLVCVAAIVFITLYVLHVIGRGGLIGGIQLADSGGQVSFGQAWGAGVQHFWTVLLIGLLVAILAILISAGSVLAAATVCLTPLACVGFLLAAVLGVFTYLAQIAAVTQNLGVSEAFGRAWDVVTRNLGPVVLLAVILLIITVVVGLVLAIPFGLALTPLIVAFVAYANGSPQAAAASATIAGLCFVAWIPVAIFLGGIVETWHVSVWTLAYKQLSTAPAAGLAPVSPAPAAS
jgi:hypothetical protein